MTDATLHSPTARSADISNQMSANLCAFILVGSICFNAGLAVINGHVKALSPALVIVAEAAFVGSALIVAFRNWRSEMAPALGLIIVLFAFAILRASVTGSIEPKYFRDTLIIPAFLLLGLASGGTHLTRTVLILHVIVFLVFLLEALAPSVYAEVFRIQDYYINTRGNNVDEFYNSNSDLFISATRPNERFVSFIDAPRMSSIFLEPVSLGNYCTIIVAFLCASFRRYRPVTLAFFAISIIAMLVGCDGRFAIVCSAAIIGVSIVSPRLPSRTAVLYLPLSILLVYILTSAVHIRTDGDDFIGRVAHTMELLSRFDVAEFLGVSDKYIAQAMDSGVAYLIITQSLLGLILLWVFVSMIPDEHTDEQVRFTHAASVYLALSMLVSYSFLTIKTGALMWFIQGALQAGRPAEWRRSQSSSRKLAEQETA